MAAPSIVKWLSYLPQTWKDTIVPPQPIHDVVNDTSKVQLSRLSHAYYSHPNLEKFDAFARDFGFIEVHRTDDTIWYRGYGVDQYVYVASRGRTRFGGPAFVAKDRKEFEKALRIPGGILHALDGLPGGGELITFNRPNGTAFHVLSGQTTRPVDNLKQPPSETHETVGPFNTPFEKPRKGQFQRYHEGPALVHKLGHFGYACKEFDEELDFYTSNFNFVHSDILNVPELTNFDALTFMHLDLGDEFSDHHCFFMQRLPPSPFARTYVHHSSYEVADVDTQLIGHQWLARKGWKSVWGVGRHILGSQIFDYWADPTGFKVEHYADGDVVNKDTPTRRHPLGPLSIWGPELPNDFGSDGTRRRWF